MPKFTQTTNKLSSSWQIWAFWWGQRY